MKMRKVLLLAAMTAALGSMNMFAAFADVEVVEPGTEETEAAAADENLLLGWVQDGSEWRYYNTDGSAHTGWVKESDGHGTEVWYYIDPATGLMLHSATRVIDGVSYSFNEDGSGVAPVATAPRGKLTGGSFYNTWSNLKIQQVIGTTTTDHEAEDLFADSAYAVIGNPKVTHDLYMSADFGDLEIYYANMKDKPAMDAATFATELGKLEKGSNGQASAVETATVANQPYSKVVITKTNKKNGKQYVTTFYCRKLDSYMVVICTSGSMSDSSALADIVNAMTTAQ